MLKACALTIGMVMVGVAVVALNPSPNFSDAVFSATDDTIRIDCIKFGMVDSFGHQSHTARQINLRRHSLVSGRGFSGRNARRPPQAARRLQTTWPVFGRSAKISRVQCRSSLDHRQRRESAASLFQGGEILDGWEERRLIVVPRALLNRLPNGL
jgi:hypothetical protein